MLAHLTIRDLAIIDELQLELHPGLTVVTGETGAGKSVLVAGLSLLLGGRANTSLLRAGGEEAVVEGLWLLPAGAPTLQRLESMGLRADDGALVVRRVLSAKRRHKAFVNGSPVTMGMLRELVAELADISSQHEHQSLLRPDAARTALDAFAGIAADVTALGAVHARASACRRELDALRRAAREREARLDYLGFQIDEIDAFGPQAGEDEALKGERARLRHGGRLLEGAALSLGELYEQDEAVVGRLGVVEARLEELVRLDESLGPALDRLAEARIAVEEAAAVLRDYQGGVELDPQRLDAVEQRLFQLEHLLRKHGPGLEDLLERRRAMQAEVDELGGGGERQVRLEQELADHTAELAARARKVSAARRRAARSLAARVEAVLAELGMPLATFALQVEPLDEVGPSGSDGVEMLFGPNPGEPAAPLRRIASGGELSRVMLGIKRALAEVDPVPCYLYDEVDTGVSGPVAESIGVLLRGAATGRQVICITHHPQVAARGNHHLRVSKAVERGRTVSRVEELSAVARVEELARMLGGATPAEATRQHAAALLERAGG